jgi:hypothetical protein
VVEPVDEPARLVKPVLRQQGAAEKRHGAWMVGLAAQGLAAQPFGIGGASAGKQFPYARQADRFRSFGAGWARCGGAVSGRAIGGTRLFGLGGDGQ